MSIAGLNTMAAASAGACRPSLTTPTKVQMVALATLVCKVRHMITKLEEDGGTMPPATGGMAGYEPTNGMALPALNADAVDLPPIAATCDPAALVPASFWKQLAEPGGVFVETSGDAATSPHARAPFGAERTEYLRLTWRELQLGKLRLATDVAATGSVFARSKAGDRQRPLWNGRDISLLAARPPKPPSLANPSCFGDLVVQKGEQIFFSKRDASSFFDTLVAPRHLRRYFGRPRVRLADLASTAGCSVGELLKYVDDAEGRHLTGATWVFPCSVTWPQGFSWSSAVAQHTTLAICERAGLPRSAVISPDRPPPSDQQEVAMVCTDDTIFVHRCARRGKERLTKYDAAATKAGIILNRAKDVTLQDRMTALGCDACSKPPSVGPAAAKLRSVLSGAMDLVVGRRCSPAAFQAWLGSAQWFCLLERWLFSCFFASYAFARHEPADCVCDVPLEVGREVQLFVSLAPFLTLPLDREIHPGIIASDATPDFGFGVATVGCTVDEARELCRLAEKRGDFVRPAADVDDPAMVPRVGTAHHLSLPQRAFRQVISRRARWKAHSGSLEAHGLLLAVRSLARRPCVHGKRVPTLVDAKTIVCAAGKGRSSAPTIRRTMARIGANVLAADLALKVLYVPTEGNPADGPSRGHRPGHAGTH